MADFDFDFDVIGGGTGNNVAVAADAGFETALVEPGPLDGICLNRGCTPSKMLIQAANGILHAHPTLSKVVESAFRDVSG